jgi:hypothetical protein
MAVPFAFFQFPKDWLDIRHLYLVSVGFVVVVSSGGIFCSRLISNHRLKRFVPILVPIFFIVLSRFIVTQLDRNYEIRATLQRATEYREELARDNTRVTIENGELHMIDTGE